MRARDWSDIVGIPAPRSFLAIRSNENRFADDAAFHRPLEIAFRRSLCEIDGLVERVGSEGIAVGP